MDKLTRALVASAVEVFRPPGPVVEIGSLQVDADESVNLRPLFPGRQYVGCDMRPGPGVDRVERLEALSFPDGYAGTVLCLNVIEHAWDFRKGVEEIVRVTAPGGLALMTTAFAIRVHGYPEDYWRFTPRAMERLFEAFPSHLYGWQSHEKDPHLVLALGLKAEPDDLDELAAAWRRAALARWDERPPLRVRIGAAFGGAMFGKRHFRTLRHFSELSIRVGRPGETAGDDASPSDGP